MPDLTVEQKAAAEEALFKAIEAGPKTFGDLWPVACGAADEPVSASSSFAYRFTDMWLQRKKRAGLISFVRVGRLLLEPDRQRQGEVISMFRVGQKVVCVSNFGAPELCEGSVYTVAAMIDGGVEPREVAVPWPFNSYRASRFRPAVDRPADISVFTDILHKSDITEPV